MPRFTLRDVFWCVTLVGLGIGGLTALLRREPPDGDYAIVVLINVWFWFPAMIGAGLGALFHRKALGALVAVLVAWAWLFVDAMHAMH